MINKKWTPKLFCKRSDGGDDSGVTAYFLIEWKPIFSIGILHFKKGSREAYHSHAFNALTWWLRGDVYESRIDRHPVTNEYYPSKMYFPSVKPKYTPRKNLHKIIALTEAYALTLRGPWKDTWQEYKNGKYITLTHGRKEINNEKN